MAENIYHGYLINKKPFQTFDEIITFITESGQIFTCLSLGSRRIQSKNARHLFNGSWCEFQIFESRSYDKMSKLKKVYAIHLLDWKFETNQAFNLLNECVYAIKDSSKRLFNFYQQFLNDIIDNKMNERIMMAIILREICTLLGIDLEVNKCVRCGNNKLKTISFKERGMICNLCLTRQDQVYDLNVNKYIHYLFNRQYDQLTKLFSETDFVIKLLKIFIEDNSGIKFKTLGNF